MQHSKISLLSLRKKGALIKKVELKQLCMAEKIQETMGYMII